MFSRRTVNRVGSGGSDALCGFGRNEMLDSHSYDAKIQPLSDAHPETLVGPR